MLRQYYLASRPVSRGHRLFFLELCLGLLMALCGLSQAADKPADIAGAPQHREESFEFKEKPSFRKVGKDQYEIRFACQGKTDVTVAILDKSGKIVRHLVSGVLGPNAPKPLVKDSLEQKLTWDGKNDLGRYVDEPETCTVRVSVGLKTELDKVLFWHPNRLPWAVYGIAADKDGVYLLTAEGNPSMTTAHQPPGLSSIMVYDHQGAYKKTILPLPRDKVSVDSYAKSPMHGQPGGKDAPKGLDGPPFAFTQPDGKTVISSDENGQYFRNIESNAFMVSGGTITGVLYPGPHASYLQFFQLKTDGSRPQNGFYGKQLGDRGGTGACWTAASPDGKWIYLSALGNRVREYQTMNYIWDIKDRKEKARHAVFRIPAAMDQPLEKSFLGVDGESGSDNGHFKFPEAVSCDGQGRIYVADRGNDRVQVFDADGKLIKSIAVPEPFQALVHPQTGAIYVLSYPVKTGEFRLLKFDGLDKAKPSAEQLFKAPKLGTKIVPMLCLDSWAEATTIWLTDAEFHVQLWVDKGDRFEMKRNLYDDLKKDWKGKIIDDEGGGTGFSSNFFVGNITADNNRPYLYLGDSRLGGPIFRGAQSPRINTQTGQVEIVPGANVIGYDGLGYVRDGNKVTRFDPDTGKPVAFDYGAGDKGVLDYRFSSDDGIGFGVSPSGKIIYHDRWPPVPGLVKTHEQFHVANLESMKIPAYMRQPTWAGGKSTSLKGYDMRKFFPGQIYLGSGALLIYDESGQMVNNDAVGGLPRIASGVRMDAQGNIYVGVPLAKMVDGKPLPGHSVVKFPPTGGRFMVSGDGVPIPLTEPPNRPADFLPLCSPNPEHDDKGPKGQVGYGDKCWGEDMCWSVGGYFPFNNTKCVCLNGRFDLDFFARSFIPESYRNSVTVVDTNGNFILRLGQYGNQDDRGPDICMGHCRYVAVNDNALFLNDVLNKRILMVALKYHQEAGAAMAKE